MAFVHVRLLCRDDNTSLAGSHGHVLTSGSVSLPSNCGTHQVVQHADSERSFHVFYYFVAGLDGKICDGVDAGFSLGSGAFYDAGNGLLRLHRFFSSFFLFAMLACICCVDSIVQALCCYCSYPDWGYCHAHSLVSRRAAHSTWARWGHALSCSRLCSPR